MAGKDKDDYFLDPNDQDEYFLKLIPDFSVFDLVEKYYIDNNVSEETKKSNNNISNKIKELFYYKKLNLDEKVSTTFYRAIFKIIDLDKDLIDFDNNNNYIIKRYTINDDLYLVVMSMNNLIEFTLKKENKDKQNIKEKTIIGVAF